MGVISFLEEHMLSCQWKQLGVECMGCGMQRSLIYLLKGDFIAAFYMYPAIYSLIGMFVYLGFHLKFAFKNGHKILLFLFVSNVLIMLTNYILKSIN
ncbi:DUF2752 domain-containing protein [Aureibaculum luteum]|uniref:DUF2752 domain-containing protein n=1 Tax=Aureibaculum luteum TaxID=1548456 RepID=UPI000E500269|nr:DUF2752 domain-containing protein [Aureibaculum luteum]